jgi:hypothetical protein
MSDTLDQDVQALQEWLGQAWRYLAQPSFTRFQRQEMRNQMRLADAKLRAGLQKIPSEISSSWQATEMPIRRVQAELPLAESGGMGRQTSAGSKEQLSQSPPMDCSDAQTASVDFSAQACFLLLRRFPQ